MSGFSKQALRKNILKQLRIQKEDTRLKKSQTIQTELFSLPEFKKAKTILFYVASSTEVQTLDMIKKALGKGKKILVPVCNKKKNKITPCFLSNPDTELARGAYGIPEPKCKIPLNLASLDLVIVPGVAFDKKGNRLGRGLGYYDRFLRDLPAELPKIGLAFDFQVLKNLQSIVEPRDFPVDKVICA